MSATDELRRLLDERGVEWEAWNDCITVVPPSTHYLEVSNGTLCVAIVDATHEQAVAATLGRGTCEDMSGGDPCVFICSYCGAMLDHPEHERVYYCPRCGAKVVRQ